MTLQTEYQEIQRYLQRMLRNYAAAEDLTQETFLKWTKQLESVKSEIQNRRAWLYRTARNAALDWLRRMKKGNEVYEFLAYRAAVQPRQGENPAEALERKENEEMLLVRFRELPPRQREAVRLKFQEKLSYEEIAEVMGESRSTVGWLLHEAIRTLRKTMLGQK